MRARVLVTGAGGFIGHHLATRLRKEGFFVRGADLKQCEFKDHDDCDEFYKVDLREQKYCDVVTKNIDFVFNLAADMGGIGYITEKRAEIAENNSLININMLRAARNNGIRRFLFSSSACIYPSFLQRSEDVSPLCERDAYPADPEPGYGWEKLYAEHLCECSARDFGLDIRIVRFHNVYGPQGTWTGGKEKAPAAICRKIAMANEVDEIEVWGDGKQTRSFMYIDDCVEGLMRIMNCNYSKPLNLGRDDLISVRELVELVAKIAKKRIDVCFNANMPQGVRGRNSNNSVLKAVLGWQPGIDMESGLIPTYRWIQSEVSKCATALKA